MLFEIPIFLFVFGLQNSAKEFFSNGKFFDNFLGIFFFFFAIFERMPKVVM